MGGKYRAQYVAREERRAAAGKKASSGLMKMNARISNAKRDRASERDYARAEFIFVSREKEG